MSTCFDEGKYEAIVNSEKFSAEKLSEIRNELEESLRESENADKFSVITTGSFARKEASKESDLDLFLISDDECDLSIETTIVNDVISKHIPKLPGTTETFGANVVDPIQVLLHDIGGENDDNKKLTRRMLLLLEGEWLFNEGNFNSYRRRLIEKYIKEGISDAKIAKFLLNDIIRYYRTIATDFEYKVSEVGKSWGLRNIKLLFSRKLIYFSGIIIVAETYNLPRDNKIEKVLELINLTPLERISCLGEGISSEILKIYDDYLSTITEQRVRESLDSVKRATRNENPDFLELKERGKRFSQELSRWLKDKYSSDHPIHHSLLF